MSIRSVIKELVGSPSVSNVICTVGAVHDNTVDVSPVNGDADIYNVLLQADDKRSSLYIKPKKGSYVVVTMINDTQGFVSQYSEIDGIGLRSGSNDMASLVKDTMDQMLAILDIIQDLKVVTPAGPSSNLLPDSLISIVDVRSKITVIKRHLSSILIPL